MKYTYDDPFADNFICNGDVDFHDYYYISPGGQALDSLFYCVNRTGIESKAPEVFTVERGSNTKYCEIFCLFSGNGTLTFRDQTYQLRPQQLVILPPKEAHAYTSDPNDPLGQSWIEFYGGDSERIVSHIVNTQGAVIEGAVFSDVSSTLGILQQHLMMDETYNPSREIYHMLFSLLQYETRFSQAEISQSIQKNFVRAEAYIDAHLGEKITNQKLAEVCGISVPYFMKQFKTFYHMTPQEYVMYRRLLKSRHLLLQTDYSIDEISEMMGFCNTSHFIRRFHQTEGMPPAHYRQAYRITSR